MSDVTRILSQIQHGDPSVAEQLLPLVYAELRRLAAAKLAREQPGHILEPTALVHEVYVRLVDVKKAPHWESRGHFFAAAAEAMRRILVEQSRRKAARKRGGDLRRVGLPDVAQTSRLDADELLALDQALSELEHREPEKAQIVKLKFFAGLSLEETAKAMGLSRATTQRYWAYARAWLFGKIQATRDQDDAPRVL